MGFKVNGAFNKLKKTREMFGRALLPILNRIAELRACFTQLGAV
jgi:hypothetical protein